MADFEIVPYNSQAGKNPTVEHWSFIFNLCYWFGSYVSNYATAWSKPLPMGCYSYWGSSLKLKHFIGFSPFKYLAFPVPRFHPYLKKACLGNWDHCVYANGDFKSNRFRKQTWWHDPPGSVTDAHTYNVSGPGTWIMSIALHKRIMWIIRNWSCVAKTEFVALYIAPSLPALCSNLKL